MPIQTIDLFPMQHQDGKHAFHNCNYCRIYTAEVDSVTVVAIGRDIDITKWQ